MSMKIGVITHYGPMESEFSYLAESENCELFFRVGIMEFAVAIAKEMEETLGVDAFISTEVTGEILQKHVSKPVIPLRINNFNLIDAFHRARQKGSKIAFADISHQTCVYDFNKISEILGYDLRRYKFDHPMEAFNVVRRVIDDGCDVIATTASCTLNIAKRFNLPGVLIGPGAQDMLDAIATARETVAVQRKEMEKYHWLNVILDSANEGFVTTNEQGVITSANQVIQGIVEVEGEKIIGRTIEDVAAQAPLLGRILSCSDSLDVVNDDTREFVVSRRNIGTNRFSLGCVFKIEELQHLQHVELEARKKAQLSGFVAKYTFNDIIGVSPSLCDTVQRAKRYAMTDSHILIYGETGSGKEVFAQSIHNASPYRNGPFVDINCATLPENLLDSELFGFEDGAFTGAKKGGKAGLFELAHNGTLFLDEISDMPPPLQVKLLRVIQERTVRRIGGSRNIPFNVRILMASNKDLHAEVLDGNFREDLFYRINVLNLRLPPLRERPEDIPLLVHSLIKGIADRRRSPIYVESKKLEHLKEYDWPGNTRQLNSFVEQVLAVADSNVYDQEISRKMLRELQDKRGSRTAQVPVASNQLLVSIDSMRAMQDAIIAELYKKYGGNKKAIENTLEISNTTLWRRFKKMGGMAC